MCAIDTLGDLGAHVAAGTPHPDDHREDEHRGDQVQHSLDNLALGVDANRLETERCQDAEGYSEG